MSAKPRLRGRPANIIIRPTLLTQQRVAVGSSGDLVTITVGNATLRVHYESALLLSQWIRLRAKEAKRRAGDTARHWSAIGTLRDASETRW